MKFKDVPAAYGQDYVNVEQFIPIPGTVIMDGEEELRVVALAVVVNYECFPVVKRLCPVVQGEGTDFVVWVGAE